MRDVLRDEQFLSPVEDLPTLAYFRAFARKFMEEGDVYVNVTWVSEAEFKNLKSAKGIVGI